MALVLSTVVLLAMADGHGRGGPLQQRRQPQTTTNSTAGVRYFGFCASLPLAVPCRSLRVFHALAAAYRSLWVCSLSG